MWRSPEPCFDVISAISQGGRDYQEDTIITDFPLGTSSGVVVLADGMGGHAAGDVASNIVVTEVFSELKFQSYAFSNCQDDIPASLVDAAKSANECLLGETRANPETSGMGSTLVSIVIQENHLFWISVGDSPLYILRGSRMEQLNEDHSMAPQIDFMVASGMISAEAGQDHPDRNCLTSVLMGEAVAKIDCPVRPFVLERGDILLVSSDGLQFLDNNTIKKILLKHRKRKSAEIASYLMAAIRELDDPEQDNISFSVVKVNHFESADKKDAVLHGRGANEFSHVGTTVANLNADLAGAALDVTAERNP